MASSESHLEEPAAAKAIAPADWLACWIKPDTTTKDPYFQAHTVSCADTTPETYPFRPKEFSVEFITAKDDHGSKIFSGASDIGTIPNDAFPLQLKVKFRMAPGDGWGQNVRLKREVSIASLAAATADKPITFSSPVAIWPVEIHVPAGNGYLSSGYPLSVAPYTVGANFNTPDNDPPTLNVTANAELGASTIVNLLAPLGDGPHSLELIVNGTRVSVDGPGTYTFANGTLAKGAGAPASEGAATCGHENQTACDDGECAPGFDHGALDDICVACGGAGQPSCGIEAKCNAGMRLAADGYRCEVDPNASDAGATP